VKAIRGFACEDARGFYLPHLRIEQTDRNTFVIYRDGQQIEEGVEIRKIDARELAEWLLNWSAKS
jgi:hypothetical protein